MENRTTTGVCLEVKKREPIKAILYDCLGSIAFGSAKNQNDNEHFNKNHPYLDDSVQLISNT